MFIIKIVQAETKRNDIMENNEIFFFLLAVL